jgi:Xaa-Pro aminopeptidase
MPTELEIKSDRLAEFLDRHRLDGVLLQERRNFAWITAGADNHVANDSVAGSAAILATADSQICLATTIEAPRMELEELAGRDIELVSVPWWDLERARRTARDLIGSATVACDVDVLHLGLPALPVEFAELRWSLTAEEVDRFREGAGRLTRAVEETCLAITPGDSEHELAGLVDDNIRRNACNPIVTLVAADSRIDRFRHPIPTAKKVQQAAMLVSSAVYRGLVSSVTRLVHFGALSDEVKRRHEAVCAVDATAIVATRPGQTVGDVLMKMQHAYRQHGFEDDWQRYDQGGPTGYTAREFTATPGSLVAIRPNQAFAWNPSIAGTCSGDTIIATEGGGVILTGSGTWPVLVPSSGQPIVPRPDILVRS